MAELWTFNGSPLTVDGKWDVEEVIEGLGIPGLRGENIQIPHRTGLRWIKKRYKERKLVMSMWIRGTSRINLDENIDMFTKKFGVRGLYTLQRTMRNGAIRYAQAEVDTEIHFVTKNPGYAKFALEFKLVDPFFYGSTKTVETKTIAVSPFEWTHVNSGSAPAVDIKITFTGPLTSPKLTNQSNGIWIQYLGGLEAGDTAIIETADFSCLHNTTPAISAIKHGGDANWLELVSGNNALKLESEVAGGTVTIEYYPTYF